MWKAFIARSLRGGNPVLHDLFRWYFSACRRWISRVARPGRAALAMTGHVWWLGSTFNDVSWHPMTAWTL